MARQFLRTDNAAKRILSVEFVRDYDDCPDLSHLGEYTNDGSAPGAIERENVGRGEYRYFVPAMTGEETGNPDSPRQDFERMEDYNRGEWNMTFCRAVAEVSIGGVIQRVTSGGIGGVESDSGEDYFAELRADEFADLGGVLRQMGFSARAVKAAFKEAE